MYGGIAYGYGIIGRIEAKNLLSFRVDNGVVVTRMVVTEEHNIEAGHLACNVFGGVFHIIRRGDSAVSTRVEQANDNVGTLFFL